jgi:hypothetical protein
MGRAFKVLCLTRGLPPEPLAGFALAHGALG